MKWAPVPRSKIEVEIYFPTTDAFLDCGQGSSQEVAAALEARSEDLIREVLAVFSNELFELDVWISNPSGSEETPTSVGVGGQVEREHMLELQLAVAQLENHEWLSEAVGFQLPGGEVSIDDLVADYFAPEQR